MGWVKFWSFHISVYLSAYLHNLTMIILFVIERIREKNIVEIEFKKQIFLSCSLLSIGLLVWFNVATFPTFLNKYMENCHVLQKGSKS